MPSDAEVICEWMDSQAGSWWMQSRIGVGPVHLSLDALHEVEERLTEAQWRAYRREFRAIAENDNGNWPLGERIRDALHASPEQKIKALAQAIRSGQ